MPRVPGLITMNLLPDRSRSDVPTRVFEGYIGNVTDESVTFFPRLDRRYSIEIRKADVMEFEAGLPSGACRFVVRTSAPVEERITFQTVARRPTVAAQVRSERTEPDRDGWIIEAVPQLPGGRQGPSNPSSRT